MLIALWEDSANVQVQQSLDGGATWSTATDALLLTGGVLAAFQGEILDTCRDPRQDVTFMAVVMGATNAVLASRDDGLTWTAVLA
jgi:hypothetical protein